ncbi:MAG: ammonium transporter [Bacteroidetes bacterium]|nr:ammonium transporter [Bacteroidota bacterium]
MPLPDPSGTLSAADTTLMLISTALVVLMTPALAFFYGGLVRSKNALNTMMMSFISLGFVGVAWIAIGYSLAFAPGNGVVGGLTSLGLAGVGLDVPDGSTIPSLLFAVFQGTFVIITAALISGAIVERMRFGPYLTFITLWSILVYAPVAHWVWGGGWLGGDFAALDFAGGTVVHINAAAAAVVAAIYLGPRRDYGKQALLPHNVPFVLLGAGLLWFGWFGFNGGSALAANESAVLAFANTFVAPSAALVAWALLETLRNGKVTAVGGATAIVVGLVAVTPAAGFVSPLAAMAIGAAGSVASYFVILWRARTRLDDSLDVMAAHGIGGLVGAILVGVFAQAVWGGSSGLVDGNPRQVLVQLIGIVATAGYSAVATFILLKLINAVSPVRAAARAEGVGLDVALHSEEAYSHGEGAILLTERDFVPGVAVSVSPQLSSTGASA